MQPLVLQNHYPFMADYTFLLYLDPGTGSFIVQMLIAGFLAVAFYFKLARDTVKSWFLNVLGKSETEDEVAK